MPEMSEKRHDPVGGNGNCSAQKLEHLREKSEQELLDELTQTMKWSDQEVDLDAIDAYLKVLEEKGYSFISAQVEMVPQNYITLSGEGDLKNMQKLVDMLEDNDDVQNVWHNWDNE